MGAERRDASALILCGGRATRFGGVAKHQLVVDGVAIADRLVRAVEPHVAEILASASDAPIAGTRAVRDSQLGTGPLAGIAGGLAACTTDWLVVVAGDMPYVTSDVIALLIARARDGVDAVGVRAHGLPEPLLCALRTGTVRPVLEARLARGAIKASGLLEDPALRVAWIEEAALRDVDPELRCLRNVNAPGDLG